MRLLVCFLSLALFSCVAHSSDPLSNYDPEDHITVDEKGKIKIIEDESLRQQTKEKTPGGVCLTLRLDESDQFVFDVKKCEKGSGS